MRSILISPLNKAVLALCFALKAQATDLYDLKEEIFFQADPVQTSYLKQAYAASEDFPFPPQFMEQTRKMIGREAAFRGAHDVAAGTNIAQMCVYAAYNDAPGEWKAMEVFDERRCKGQLYLSGNDPVSFGKKEEAAPAASVYIQKIGHEKGGYTEVRQRFRPLLTTVTDTVGFLERIGDFVENPDDKVQGLAAQARAKHAEITKLLEQRDMLVLHLCAQASRLERREEAPEDDADLIHGFRKCMAGILRELSACLQADDFGFHDMGDTKSNKNVKAYLELIQKKLAERELRDVLNSKYFNLGCSEPLLLADLLGEERKRSQLATVIAEKFPNDRLEKIIVQLHSTKTPCISCLIGCCGYCRDGVIKSLFEKLGEKIRESLGKDNVALHFLISYHAPYEDEYPFYAQVTREWAVSPGSYLIVNMRLYDPQFKKMKERIVKEERLRLKRIYDEKGTITPDDLPTAFP